MAPLPVAPIIAAALGIYNPCKDLVLFVMGRRRDIKALEERISELINLLTLISSEKEKIDESLTNSVFTKESQAYPVMEAEIAVITKRYIKFIGKYAKSTTNQLSSTTKLNASTAALMIHQLNDLKSKVATKKFFKLAKLSRDVVKLSKRASAVVAILKPDYLTKKKSGPIQDKMGGGDNNVLPVFDTYADKVLEHLLEGAHTVGISGRKGVGKTTVLRKLHDRLLEQNSQWGNIIRINYPAETETEEGAKMLQNEIIGQLNMNDHPNATNSSSKDTNANIISAFLRERRYILLMDHVSNPIDLDKIGLRENHEHKKVVICSREKTVISKMTDYEVEIKGLEKVEARELFQSIWGKLYDDYKLSAVDIITDYCGGTAGMIHLIAHYLKNKEDRGSWDYVKQILQAECKSHELLDLGDFDKVYDMTYKQLTTMAKKCLLYGALFPHHQRQIYADYLIECWISEGLIAERADQKVRRNRQLGQELVNHLTQLYLLEWYTSTSKKYVMMSPDFRRVAFQLGYTEDEKCVFWVPSKDRRPDTDDWKRVTRMSLIGCNVQLPDTPECPNICTLLLQSLKPNLEQLAATFFFYMKSLQVLDLSHTEIGALPESINELTDLKGLYLNGCLHLVALPPEAVELVKLEFLDISGTSISTLPQEIGCMVSMRCLRASLSPKSCNHNELMIPPDIISKLTNLEELSFDTTFDFQQGVAVAERLAKELADLKHLNTLCFNFPNVSSLNAFVSQSKALENTDTSWGTHTFRSFKISIGCHETRRADEPDLILAERWLRYFTNEEFSAPCQELLKQASAFEIIGHHGLKSFTCSKFDLHSVKVCVVKGCNHLENIVDGGIASEEQGFSKGSSLQNLEKLYLYDLELLKCIWDGPVPATSLVSLKAITIDGCPNLTEILGPALARSLQRLEYLKVDNCCQISKIIDGSGESSNSEQGDLLDSLAKIELSNLPKLQSICESTSISCKSLKSITVMRCNNLSNLSLALTNARKLPLIRCEESWWKKVLQLPNELRERILPLCHFEEESTEPRGEASTSGSSEITEHIMSRGEASTSESSKITEHIMSSYTTSTSNMNVARSIGDGRSEFPTEHNSPAPSNTNVDEEKETPPNDNLPESQRGVQTDISGLEDDDIKSTDNHQIHDPDPDPDRSACFSHVKQSRGEQKFDKGCFSIFRCL